ncbi:MAG: hypothetical protein PHR28_11700 [candidate division Zixibacteria bacterium]|nr:hypothetical protein [candidate division Zixibacteria bacterium]
MGAVGRTFWITREFILGSFVFILILGYLSACRPMGEYYAPLDGTFGLSKSSLHTYIVSINNITMSVNVNLSVPEHALLTVEIANNGDDSIKYDPASLEISSSLTDFDQEEFFVGAKRISKTNVVTIQKGHSQSFRFHQWSTKRCKEFPQRLNISLGSLLASDNKIVSQLGRVPFELENKDVSNR